MAATADDIADRLRRALADEEGVVLAYLYGSHAQGLADERSDVDVGVLFDEPPESFRAIGRLNLRIARALDLPVERVDVRALNDASLRFLHQVVAKGRPVFARDDADRVAFEARTMDRYLDFRPMLRRQDRARRERFRRRAA